MKTKSLLLIGIVVGVIVYLVSNYRRLLLLIETNNSNKEYLVVPVALSDRTETTILVTPGKWHQIEVGERVRRWTVIPDTLEKVTYVLKVDGWYKTNLFVIKPDGEKVDVGTGIKNVWVSLPSDATNEVRFLVRKEVY